jgi:photosystem II stability/assembly factor-like uncharacterized protein
MAAAKGHPGRTGPVGVFRSTDGGVTWTHLTNGLPNLSATDLAIDPSNPNILYAGIGRIFGDLDNGLYRTTDGGDSWTKVTGGGLPGGTWGRISVAIAPSLPSRIYILITNACSATGGNATVLGAYRSDNGGLTWVSASPGNIQATYGWYLSVVAVHPTDPDLVFMGGVTLHRSFNAGASWQTVTPQHVDIHALQWTAAGDLICGDDGGMHWTRNNGTSWFANNTDLGLVQFYAGLSTHPTNAEYLLGGTQDNGTNIRSTNQKSWNQVLGGDGGWTQLNPLNPSILFAEFQGTGNLYRSTSGGSGFNWSAQGILTSDRNCFLPPYVMDPLNPNRMLYGTQRVYQSTNGGTVWSPISPDLTGGGSAAIRTLAYAPSDSNVVYAATNDSRVLRSDDGGQTFTLIASDAPGWPRVTREIFVHPTDPMTVYLAVAYFGVDQVRRSTDGGATWTSLDGDLPDIPVNSVAVDFRGRLPVVYAGGDDGLYRSVNHGTNWHRLEMGLPRTAYIDLRLEPGRDRLVVATQGRGAWEVPIGIPGDANCDGVVDFLDIEYFVAAIPGEASWAAYYASQHGGAAPPCDYLNTDLTGEGAATFVDIEPFVDLLTQ